MSRVLRLGFVAAAFLCAPAFAAAQGESAPQDPRAVDQDARSPERFERVSLVKPAFTDVRPWHEPDRVLVKFLDELPIRARDGQLVDGGSGVLSALAPLLSALGEARWSAQAKVDEGLLVTWRETAQRNLGRGIADPRSFFHLVLPPGVGVQGACDLLNTSELVELARPVQRPAPLPVEGNPVPPDWEPNQGYLDPAPDGIDARAAWFGAGTRGSGVRILDLEYQFLPTHIDLPPIGYPNQAQVPTGGNFWNSGSYTQHGTAVLGVMLARSDGAGVVGIASAAEGHFIGTIEEDMPGGNQVTDIAGALLSALTVVEAGDVIVIEQQVIGPNYPGPSEQFGLVPAEWLFDVYTAVLLAVGNGAVVVAAAGNGHQNLDGPEFSSGNNGHWPFLPANDSGAILVGAGAAPAAFGGVEPARSRLPFSNYGARLDLQGWGERIYTCGYGELPWGDPPLSWNAWYTPFFGGTSGATPIVAGAAALVQSQHRRVHGGAALSPSALRTLLRTTGTPQGGTNPSAEPIGPMPDVFAALFGGAVWVDFGAGPVQTGTFQSPFATLAQATAAVAPGGRVFLKAGATSAGITISAPMTLGSYGGPVTIGSAGP